MTQQYQADGISFRYPADWRLDREESEDGWTVLLQSPGTAFMTLTCDSSGASTEEMTAAALAALRADYPTLDATPQVETLAGQMAMGHDIQFFSLDLTNTCWTRSFYNNTGAVLILCQVNDTELDEYEPVLRAICASLKVEEEPPGDD
ncbi:MAG TPA: hypothetical protein VN688_33475 [Gemmataceae bacterium]|nr:hypothetical protein [Gemmataceae bacterium]